MWKLIVLVIILCGGAGFLVAALKTFASDLYVAIGAPTLAVLLAIALVYVYLRYRPATIVKA
jgi:hypothetical protein